MFIEALYNFILFLKNQGQSRYYTPEEVIDALNRAVMDVYENHYRIFQQTQKITDELRVFMVDEDVDIDSGFFSLPELYRHMTNMSAYKSTDEVPSTQLTEGEWVKKKGSSYLPATTDYPFHRIFSDKVEVLPNTVSKVRMYYIKKPTKAVYAYTMVNGRPVFDEANSTDVEFPEFVHNHLVVQTLKYLGVPLKDAVLMQFEQLQPQKNG